MFRAILAGCLVLVCGVASGQTTITVSNFNGSGSGFTTHTQFYNGQWNLSPMPGGVVGQVKPAAHVMQTPPLYASLGQNPAGAMVTARQISSGVEVTFHTNTPAGYVPVMKFGLFGTTGTIIVNGYPGDTRTISVQ